MHHLKLSTLNLNPVKLHLILVIFSKHFLINILGGWIYDLYDPRSSRLDKINYLFICIILLDRQNLQVLLNERHLTFSILGIKFYYLN